MLSDCSVIVTGAGGFLGSVVAGYFAGLGVRVVRTGHRRASDSRLVQVDLEDDGSVATLARHGPFDAVIHCAAVLPGQRSDLDLLIANQRMTYHLATWTVRNGIGCFLYASTCSIYGYSGHACTEATLPQSPNLYAVSKLACEHILSLVTRQSKTRVCSLRISAPYGPNQQNETVVTRFLKQASQGMPLRLMGSGSRSQDFVYQEDVARAFYLALQHKAVGVFNISGDRSVSMRELCEAVLRIFGKSPAGNILTGGDDPQESFRGRFPVQAASNSFGYRSQVSLEVGLLKTAQGLGLL